MTLSWRPPRCCIPTSSSAKDTSSKHNRARLADLDGRDHGSTFRSRTPSPSPFSSMKITPARSKASRIARKSMPTTGSSAPTFCARRTTSNPTLARRASVGVPQPRSARASRIGWVAVDILNDDPLLEALMHAHPTVSLSTDVLSMVFGAALVLMIGVGRRLAR